MRIMIKGGVWKNTEDEILKAAVMKYGKNQWSRISSLLVRKSAKQCKARWYEWLDPSIRKTEWTRDEDEKLLHLAKLMPTQWRTIAPIVGRTAAQCLERYEKLLDAACAKDENYDPGDDPRRLRPGEIDPNPESKPARPDPVDMDEDEKEMLSEARARLANTKGKKAKRKAREKQLEEARRLASLQKKRELKAAGLDTMRRARKRKGIDYATEIPFEKKPAPGFFDTSHEGAIQKTDEELLGAKGVDISELDDRRRADIELGLRKTDIKKVAVHERHNLPDHVRHVNEMNDTNNTRKRSKLMLPAPQISERELEDIAQMGAAGTLHQAELESAGGVTRSLLNDYATPSHSMAQRTPMRTPMRTQGDTILQEAENLYRLSQGQTPLIGGENPELHQSDFSGATPRKMLTQTPNPLATPRTNAGGTTPSVAAPSTRGGGTGPGATPIRDGLNINDPEYLALGGSAREEKEKARWMRQELRTGLGSLPAPKNEYQIMVPEMGDDQDDDAEPMEEDMADRLARRAQLEAEAAAREMRKRSKAIQRDLPRPAVLSGLELEGSKITMGRASAAMQEAAGLIAGEMKLLLEHDSAKYPLTKKDKKPKEVPELAVVDLEEMVAAAALIEAEAKVVREGMGHSMTGAEEYAQVWDTCFQDVLWLPSLQSYGRTANATNSDRLDSVKGEFEAARAEMEKDAKKAAKLEQKVNMLTAGYASRAAQSGVELAQVFEQAAEAKIEVECFKALQRQELAAAPARLERLTKEVEVQREREKVQQLKYEMLRDDRDALLQRKNDRLAATAA
mmetsp:Transcript_32000/g.53782  ORF Transcript_32000/g.53782 Transcript_32000/m.53782 type:complete len:795 (-) Transcript_32000:163-2547(-)|eukprot:CAMPEP_0198201212 /NCGR_PEP_ID=MMETSP1445-20131203/3968_1 /TAXON_ID=36898 /ORGANISM="Pyramimonas sp., Strain CCMP2087" /LENGTH=794 /DNA_ID=CAMNT_0043871419 /DNA_START=109 /DNA_END=2493 /DNA_ORIENTATION=+